MKLTQEEIEKIKKILDGEIDLSKEDELFEKLFNHYCDNGEMLYGTQKARTGDPYKWIIDKLSKQYENSI